MRVNPPTGRPRRSPRLEGGEHLTDLQIADYLDDVLSSERRQAIEAHIAGCTSCRNAIAVLEQFDEAVNVAFTRGIH